MVAWIEPLNLGVWINSVFAGTPDIFLAIALFVIFGTAGYFRMNMIATFFMMAVFLLLFSAWISSGIIVLIAIVGGLLIGKVISNITER